MIKSKARFSVGEIIGLLITIGFTILFAFIFLLTISKHVISGKGLPVMSPAYLLGMIAILWTYSLVKRLKNWKSITVHQSGVEVNYKLGKNLNYTWEQITGTWKFDTRRRSLGQAIKLIIHSKEEINIIAYEFSNYDEIVNEIALFTKEISDPLILNRIHAQEKRDFIISTLVVWLILCIFMYYLFFDK